MKKQEFIQIKGLDLKELNIKAKALKDEIASLTLDKNMKKLKDFKMVSKKKKELAQILTVIRQKELLGQLESQVKHKESNEEVSKVKKEKK
ncbi:50S ribosomal protein L29 [Candidatus Daviesbacteria bacterium]|nr:50S ribosomal protein L29 [Candidatus Daviesbacteria bacterium]